VNIDIPIFNGHLFSARKEAAHYQSLAADQRIRTLQQQVERDVRAAWVTASTAYQRIPVTVALLKEAQLALELAQGRYSLGLASIVEITQAQLNLTQAQIENVALRRNLTKCPIGGSLSVWPSCALPRLRSSMRA